MPIADASWRGDGRTKGKRSDYPSKTPANASQVESPDVAQKCWVNHVVALQEVLRHADIKVRVFSGQLLLDILFPLIELLLSFR
eukprot:4159984-Amphidinium_carterae.1